MKKVNLPKRIKFAGLDVDIEIWDHDAALASQCYGQYSPVEGLIRIDPANPPRRIAETLLHESLHAIWDHYHMQGDPAEEEQIVSVLATALIQIFRDNPEFLELLTQVMEKEDG